MTKTILFQGDSITDSCRYRDEDAVSYSGHGYATMSIGEVGFKYPEQYVCFNKGISGNRIVDLYARIKADIINLKPDFMSILIGINDVWHELGSQNGVDAEKFEKIYSMLIEEVKAALPDIKIMILEPFVLKSTATTSNANYEDLYPIFRAETQKRAIAAKRVAEKYGLKFIPLQEKFDAVYNPEKPSYWLYDGVHPTQAGHTLIKEEWIKGFESIR